MANMNIDCLQASVKSLEKCIDTREKTLNFSWLFLHMGVFLYKIYSNIEKVINIYRTRLSGVV